MSVNTKINNQLVRSAGLYKASVPIGYGDCYSAVEREVGCWVDGRPIYQLTYYISALPSSVGATTYSVGTTNVERVWLKDCMIGIGNGFIVRNDQTAYSSFYTASITFRPSVTDGDVKIHCYNGQDRHTTDAYVTVRYIKSTDTPGSGMWLPNGNYAHHYSTDEQIIGTWIDGSTLYEKTWDFTNQLSVNSQTWTNTIISKSGFNTIIRAVGINIDGAVWDILGARASSSSSDYVQIYSTRNTNVNIKCLILQYTKTT